MPIYVIALDGSPRLDPLARNLTDQGFSYQVVPATDLRSATDETLSQLANQHTAQLVHGQPLTGGQVGCVLSHRSVYARLLASSSDWAVVLEDDARLRPGFPEFVNQLAFSSARKPTIVCLYAGLWARRLGPPEQVVGGALLRPALFPPTGTVGYAINRSAAAMALAAVSRVTTRADWPAWSQGVDFLVAEPQLVFHEDGETTVMSPLAKAVAGTPRGAAPIRLVQLLVERNSILELQPSMGYVPRLKFIGRNLILPAVTRRVRRYLPQ